jgi:Spy/CpxP family protein refolding chaperone
MAIKNIILLSILFFSLSAQATKRTNVVSLKPSIQSLIQATLKLDLNNDQKAKIKAVMDGRLDKTKELQEKAITEMEDYLKAALKADANKTYLQKKNKQVQTAYEALRAYQLETWLSVRANLTEQQLQQLSDKQDLAFNRIEQDRRKSG